MTSEEEASGMKLHEVLFAPCLSARPLFSCHRSIARASARTSVAGPLLVCHWSARASARPSARASVTRPSARASVTRPSARSSLVRLSLVCHSSVTRLSLARHSCVCHSSVTRLSARASVTRLSLVHLLVRLSLVCHSCVCHSSVTRLSLVRLSLVCHSSICSSVCSCIVRPSLIHLLVRLLESGLFVAGPSLLSLTRLSLVCLFVRRWSVTSSVCSGRGRCPVVGLSLVFHRSVVGHGRSSI